MGRTYEEYEVEQTDDIYRVIDEVEADRYSFYFRRGSDGHVVDYEVILPFDATYPQVAEKFAQFLSEVYEYEIKLKATNQYSEKCTCDGCTNTSCLASDKGCKDAW